MKAGLFAAAVGLLGQVVPSVALKPHRHSKRMKQYGYSNPDLLSNGTFDQLLDHSDPSKGTFKQRYWWDATNWKGPGSPIFVFNAGENAADDFTGYLENSTIPGLYAQEFEGAAIVIEHRYWGQSNPFDKLTAETLQYLDVPQSVYDMTYFAKKVPLEFDDSNGKANAPNSPWVLIGGSYSGALAAWTSVLDPDVYYAYHASSAVVEAIYDFYMYYDAVESVIPRNCSSDVKAVVSHIDSVFKKGDKREIRNLQAMFGLEQLDHPDDFANYVATPVGNWQSNESSVFEFCDFIETGGDDSARPGGEDGIGLKEALPNYAAWVNATSGAYCAENECSTYASDVEFDDPTDTENDRQWNWLLCHNPFGWWQVGPPKDDGDHLVSSLLRPGAFQRQCPLMFPETNGFRAGSAEGFTTKHLNMYTGGWDADFERVLFVNGEFDPWLQATVASDYRPGGPRESTDQAPIFTIDNGNHVPDLVLEDAPEQLSVIKKELQVMRGWLKEWNAPN